MYLPGKRDIIDRYDHDIGARQIAAVIFFCHQFDGGIAGSLGSQGFGNDEGYDPYSGGRGIAQHGREFLQGHFAAAYDQQGQGLQFQEDGEKAIVFLFLLYRFYMRRYFQIIAFFKKAGPTPAISLPIL